MQEDTSTQQPKPVTRKRQTTTPTASQTSAPSSTSPTSTASTKASGRQGIPLKVHLLFLLIACGLVLYFTKHTWINKFTVEKSFTREELKKYDGSDPELPIYIGVKGKVFDVTAGRRHYGKQGSYNFFAGRDATRSFMTGCFNANEEKCTKDSHVLADATEKQLSEIDTWLEFYTNHKEYFYVGYIKDN